MFVLWETLSLTSICIPIIGTLQYHCFETLQVNSNPSRGSKSGSIQVDVPADSFALRAPTIGHLSPAFVSFAASSRPVLLCESGGAQFGGRRPNTNFLNPRVFIETKRRSAEMKVITEEPEKKEEKP